MGSGAPNTVGSIETRGIEAVPDGERGGKPGNLFWVWFGANMGVLGIVLGAALVSLHRLNVLQSFVVAVVGACGSFLLVGLLSVAGKRGGAPGLTLSRAVFGPRGNGGPTLVSWLGFVGWETIMCTTAGLALLSLLDLVFGWNAGAALTAVCVLVTVLITAVIGLFGHATIVWVQRWLTWIFGALTLAVVIFLVSHVDWGAALSRQPGPLTSVLSGIGLIAAGTGLGWLAAGADYARYLPRTSRSGSLVGVTVAGAGIPLVVLITTGALMAVENESLATAADPVAAIGSALPAWMAVPYLLTAFAGLITAADLSMYSSGLNFLTAGIRVRRTTAVAVDAVLITVGAVYITVIAKDFYGPFTTFLTLLAVPLTAWAGIFLTDMVGRRHYDPEALADTGPTGAYWYTAGLRPSALAAWLVAIVGGLLFTTASTAGGEWFSGPFAGTWFGRNGLGWLVAGVSAAVLYAAFRRVAGEPSGVRTGSGAGAHEREDTTMEDAR